MIIPIDTVWSLREGTGLGDMGGKGVRSFVLVFWANEIWGLV